LGAKNAPKKGKTLKTSEKAEETQVSKQVSEVVSKEVSKVVSEVGPKRVVAPEDVSSKEEGAGRPTKWGAKSRNSSRSKSRGLLGIGYSNERAWPIPTLIHWP